MKCVGQGLHIVGVRQILAIVSLSILVNLNLEDLAPITRPSSIKSPPLNPSQEQVFLQVADGSGQPSEGAETGRRRAG